MSYQENNDHEIFMKSVNAEIKEVKRAYEQAQKAYESVLKKFLIRNVTGKKDFKFFHDLALDDAVQFYSCESGSWAVDELDVLHSMVDDYYFWLQDGRYDAIDGGPLSESR